MNGGNLFMALKRGRDTSSSHHRYFRPNSLSIDSSCSYSDSEDDSPFDVFPERGSLDGNRQLQAELATILAANRLMSAAEKENTRHKRNLYSQEKVKHNSGGSTGGGNKMAAAWKRITDKLGKQQQQKEERNMKPTAGRILVDPWRRHSMGSPMKNNGNGLTEDAAKKANKKRASEDLQKRHSDMRQRSSSEVQRFKIVSKHGNKAEFTVASSSKLADASALCQEYFSRLTCYDAVPQFTSVIAVDTRTSVSKAFNIFYENNATAVVLWESAKNSAVGVCRVDHLVRQLWHNAHVRKTGRLFDVEGDFCRPLKEVCSELHDSCAPANTSLIDAAMFIRDMATKKGNRSSKRLILINESNGDVVHLLSAWDILHFFSEQMSKFHAAHTAFDRSLGSILEGLPEADRQIETQSEKKSLREVVGFLAERGGSDAISRYGSASHQERVVACSFLDIIQYVINVHGSWDDADGTKETLGHVLRYHAGKQTLVYSADTPLFAVLKAWEPPMSADAVVVVLDTSDRTAVGVLEPEHLLQALLCQDAYLSAGESSGSDLSFSHEPVAAEF